MSSILIGTSGYTYSWNKGKDNKFIWYVNQGFNSVEINASFYRFPLESWTSKWKKYSTKNFKFSIKVHRSITHYTRLKGNKSVNLWKRFKKSLNPIGDRISFWLFQMPSTFRFSQENIDILRTFKTNANLEDEAVIEFRDKSWWSKDSIIELNKLELSMCSVDAPLLPRQILNLNNIIYLRLHGTKRWYNYVYSEKELKKIIDKIQKKPGLKKAIYLNNDHGMLPNGKYLLGHVLIESNTLPH